MHVYLACPPSLTATGGAKLGNLTGLKEVTVHGPVSDGEWDAAIRMCIKVEIEPVLMALSGCHLAVAASRKVCAAELCTVLACKVLIPVTPLRMHAHNARQYSPDEAL